MRLNYDILDDLDALEPDVVKKVIDETPPDDDDITYDFREASPSTGLYKYQFQWNLRNSKQTDNGVEWAEPIIEKAISLLRDFIGTCPLLFDQNTKIYVARPLSFQTNGEKNWTNLSYELDISLSFSIKDNPNPNQVMRMLVQWYNVCRQLKFPWVVTSCAFGRAKPDLTSNHWFIVFDYFSPELRFDKLTNWGESSENMFLKILVLMIKKSQRRFPSIVYKFVNNAMKQQFKPE